MLSVIIPFHNEEENLKELHAQLVQALGDLGQEYELILIDDGSTDKSLGVAKELQTKDLHVKVFAQRKQMGKGEAIRRGIEVMKGNVVVLMDGDLQDDPQDIKHLYVKLNEGYDLVNGIRAKRKDNSVIKFYSRSVNSLLRKALKSPFTDINCGFKMFKREIADEIAIYGNNFRFLPLAAYYKGFRVGEVPVHNRQRLHGKSKYGMRKLFIGIIDTLTAYFLYQFSERPLHFFGLIGACFAVPGVLLTLYLTYERVFFNVLLYRRPALLAGVLLIIVGIQIVMTGMIGELIVYTSKKSSKSNKT